MEIIIRFLEWKERQKTTIRGNNLYYDIKGYYKYLTDNYWTLIWDEYFVYLKRKEQRRVKMQGLQQTPK